MTNAVNLIEIKIHCRMVKFEKASLLFANFYESSMILFYWSYFLVLVDSDILKYNYKIGI